MSRNIIFIFFLLVFSSIYFGINYYVYSRIVSGLGIPLTVRNYLKIFFFIAGLSFLVGEILSRRITVYPLVYFGALWLGVIAIAFTIFVLKDIAQLFFSEPSKFMTLLALFLVLVTSGLSLYNASRPLEIKEIKIPIEKINPKLSGFSIVQLSDLHLGILKSEKWLQRIVERTNELNPDLIVITGDLIDQDIRRFEGFCEVLKRLKSKYGIYAITGNHEFYAGMDNFLTIAKKCGFSILRNEKVTVANSIEIVGVDDDTGKSFAGVGADLVSAIQKCEQGKPIILLSHQPKNFKKAIGMGVDLQLSGHTHAGQILPMNLIILLVFKYPFGLYSASSSFIYTTSGTGTWGPPMRLFSRSEIVKIVLAGRSVN
jgi:hypothetical protein